MWYLLEVIWNLVRYGRRNSPLQQGPPPLPTPAQFLIVGGSITGLTHVEEGDGNQDRWGVVEVSEARSYAAFVVDGAGGEGNAATVGEAIRGTVDRYLRGALSKWTTEDALTSGLRELFQIAEFAAKQTGGMATIVVFVHLTDGLWGIMSVGDAACITEDSAGQWQLRTELYKFGPRRTITSLLGDKRNPSSPKILVSRDPLVGITLVSDWVCGNAVNSPLKDTQPHQPWGIYNLTPAAEALSRMLFPSSLPLSKSEVVALLEAIQGGNIPSVASARDDMTIIGLRRCMS